MKFGFTSTSFRNIKDVKKIVDIAVSAGVDCIEWGSDVHVKDIETAKYVRKICDDAGIETSSYGTFYRIGSNDTEEWKKICEIASVLGASSVRVWLGKKGSKKTDDATYENLVADTVSMCDVAKEYGLIVCPECHDHTYNDNTDAFLKIHKDVARDNFRTYFQSRYKKKAYDLDRIERTIPYVESVHVSFWELRREQFPKYEPKYMDELLDKLTSVGFDGNMLVEFTYVSYQRGLPFCMKRDIKRLKEKLNKV